MGDFTVFGWFVFNIAIPLLAPLALLPLVKIPRALRQRSRGVVMRTIQNGQLLWAAIPMSASACYLLAQHLGLAGARSQWMWTALTAQVALIVYAAVLVLLGAVEANLAPPGHYAAEMAARHVLDCHDCERRRPLLRLHDADSSHSRASRSTSNFTRSPVRRSTWNAS